ncbi:uncharacterized protein VTP21DRAFT_9118 [Calcarisporiella thermophila]|uniref:uncharacterized protein n=1 Tax=Calcarisporiella thermophila TaxID=911321 RepID=UPI003741F1AF
MELALLSISSRSQQPNYTHHSRPATSSLFKSGKVKDVSEAYKPCTDGDVKLVYAAMETADVYQSQTRWREG